MKNEIKKIISESKRWDDSEVENLSETLLFQNTIGKSNYLPIDEDVGCGEYFVCDGTKFDGFPRRI